MTGRNHPFILLHLLAAVLAVVSAVSALPAADTKPQRLPWTTSRIHGSPDPAKPYIAAQVFPKLTFREVTEIVCDPVSKRWIILERPGKIYSLPNNGEVSEATLVADLKVLHPDLDNLYGFAFHPKFAENHQVFISYTTGAGKDDGTKLSRFPLNEFPVWGPRKGPLPIGQKAQVIPNLQVESEEVILTWRSGGHNGAHLQFGPDGFLYVSTGDAEVPSPPDPLNTGQNISDLLSSILRIDVDHQDAGLAYSIPKDNPFVQTPNARPEIWAYGFRNPWKMSFDLSTGRLWCGDVGWELWEMIHLVERGGNYGWSAMEASQPIRADAPKAPTPIRPPIAAHSHDEAASITGGYVYHGHKFPELAGAYIYGDWETGKIWALWYDGKQVTRREEIADTPHKIICFGQDSDGEIIYAHYGPQGTLHTLERNPEAGKGSAFPKKLSETGLFKVDGNGLIIQNGMWGPRLNPADGVYEFFPSVSMWQDGIRHTSRQYLIGLPGMSAIRTEGAFRTDRSGAVKGNFKTTWPADSVLARTVWALPPKEASNSAVGADFGSGRRLIETQILHFDGVAWNGYSYEWNADGVEARLVPSVGVERVFTADMPDSPGAQLHWRFHSRAECMRCHNTWVGGVLAFNPMLLNDRDYGAPASAPDAVMPHELDSFLELGIINQKFIDQTAVRFTPPVLEPSLDEAARAYLHVNCSHCHRQNAGGAVTMMLNAELQLPQTRALDVPPMQGGLGLANPKLIDPGNPWNSVICVRLAKTGAGHMPVIGPRNVDVHGLRQIEDWIAQMGGVVKSASDLLRKEWNESLLREKLATVEGAMQVRRAIDDSLLKEPLRQSALEIAWRSPQPTVRDIFERFKPVELREATIGLNPDPAKLLSTRGDSIRGSSILSVQGKLAMCYACHVINGAGRDFGPDLSKVGSRLKREQILESMLHPSKVIAQGYAAVSAEMKDGAVQSGFVVGDGAHDITLKTATGQSVTLMKSDIKSQSKLPASLMPEGQLQSLTNQETADVLTYLESLR
jgi:putative heme-binding domain-containing protein